MLFGAPGSGKGTTGKMLTKLTGWPHLATGDLLREQIARKTPLGLEMQSILASGQLAPDDLVSRMVWDRLGWPDCENGFLLDGFPRTIPQAEGLAEWFGGRQFRPVLIHLWVEYNEILRRLTGRRTCPVCGAIYHVESNPSKVPGVCENDGAELTVRADDREEVVMQRLQTYQRQTWPVAETLRKHGILVEAIDCGEMDPESVADRIVWRLDRISGSIAKKTKN
ncbi:MAG: nucleoside monophosphate kinase [Acidobacteria bacterium]|nr:nucleoside monophosphate kinase [Acidobacteriota bacterium]